MAGMTIDQLDIQLTADSKKAVSALEELSNTLKRLKSDLTPLANVNLKVSNSFNTTTKNVQKTSKATEDYSKKTDKASKSAKSFTDRLAQKISKTRTLVGAFKSVANTMADWFNESNKYVETLNLFNVTMGEGAEEARKFAENVSTLMGIDPAEWMQYQGTFKNLTAGFGVASDKANIMSQNLTQLSYDMASFFNTDVETAFDKLSSAMSGQVKGLREFGIDTTVASLQEYALSKGIDASVRSMSQAEKSLLRYNYIMEKSIIMQGDMARTIITPANSLRILSAQLTQMKRALGNVVSVIAVKFIPYVQAMVQIITEAAQALATYFGFELPSIDYSSLGTGGFAEDFEDADDSLGGVADKVKKIKKQLMGFDELNIISSPDKDSGGGAGGAGGASGGGAGLDLKPLEYNFLENIDTSKVEEIKENLKEVAKWVGVIGAGAAGFKASAGLLGLGESFKGLFASILEGKGIKVAATAFAAKFKKALGVALMAGGAALDIGVIFKSWEDGVDWEGFKEQLAGAGLLHLGGFLVAGDKGMAIGAIIDGILTLIPSVKSAIMDGNESLSNTLSIVKGIATLFGGLSVLVGNWIPIAIGGVITLISLIAIYADDIWAFFKSIPERIKEFFSGIAEWINTNVIQPIKNWIDTNIGQPIAELVESIKSAVASVKAWIEENIVKPFLENVAPIKEAWDEAFGKISQAIADFKKDFDEAISVIRDKVNEIKDKFIEIYQALKWAFNEYIVKPIKEKIDAFVERIKSELARVKAKLQEWGDWLKGKIQAIWGWVKTKFIDPILANIEFCKQKIKAVIDWIKQKATELWNKFKEAVIDKILAAVEKIKKKFIEVRDSIVEKLKFVGTAVSDFISGALRKAVNGVFWLIEKAINGFIGLLNGAINIINKIPGVSISRVQEIYIPRMAEGGIVENTGQLFIAREAGPELVGSIGNKTAVANNDQIISGIESGVYRAMMAASANKGGSTTIRIVNEIDGDVVGEKVIQYHNGKVLQTGMTPLLV